MVQVPPVTDEDISWACKIMRLPADAFAGPDGTDARLPTLRRLDTVDIEACPGSGKTTLLVAKLAILARHWRSSSTGLCVLSHTNAARDEIASKLGASSEGRALLAYPHFVGTIHGFINEFLALPYLRSRGNPIVAIDNDIATRRRWKRLSTGARYAIQSKNPNKEHSTYCTYGEPDYGGGKLDLLGLAPHTPTYGELKDACKATSEEGFFCFDEMFVWARELLRVRPEAAQDIRARFPLLFMDEVQDNSEMQSSILHSIFMNAPSPVTRQRFGDSNQAIYDSPQGEGAKTDPFPGPMKVDLPNSFRFGQQIADLSDPLGVAPQGLVGRAEDGFAPTIFLFDDNSVRSVLPQYGKLLISCFASDELSGGSFVAVAGVHTGEEEDHLPRRMGHYVPSYDPSISRRTASPASMCQFVRLGSRDARLAAHSGPLVRSVAEGLLRLLEVSGVEVEMSATRSPHRRILETLEALDKSEAYLVLQDYLVREATTLTPEVWNDRLLKVFSRIFKELTAGDLSAAGVKFLAWDEDLPAQDTTLGASVNLFRHEENGSSVSVRLGSIHSVKGETHDATLVLDSYMRDHHLRALKPWLLGTKTGGTGASDPIKKRMRLHYVGMTRPRRLLCLAMRADSLADAEMAVLQKRGWNLVTCPPHIAP